VIALRFFYARWECPVVAGNVLPCLVTLQSSAGADLEAKLLLLPDPHTIRRVGAPPTEQSGVHRLLCGRPAPGRSSCSCQARTPFAARARLLRVGAHLLVWEARLGTKLLLLPGRTPFAARARLLRAGMHICLCGRPALGAKLLLAQARTPFAARARLLHSGVHGLLLWEARPRGEAFIA